MSLSFVQTSPGIIVAATVGYIGYGTFVQKGQMSWKLPAIVSTMFWGFSLYAIKEEGPFAFWQNHNQNFWGNQVFFDICFSVAIFWFAVLPRAQVVGMRIVPWFFYVCSTGSLGGLHMYARLLYLEETKAIQYPPLIQEKK